MLKTRRAKRLTAIATLALGVAFGTKADATITFLPGNNPQPGEENILFGAKETGMIINGATNMSDLESNSPRQDPSPELFWSSSDLKQCWR
jgi:hypothetical protein